MQFELLEERRLLALDSSTNGNTDSASLQAALSPDPALPFFNNIGLSSTGNASVTYLGYGWVLTAGHVTIANVITGSPGGVTFGSTHYNIDESTIAYLHNPDNSLADLKVFKMIGDPGLPPLIPSLIDTATASGRQIMMGNGLSLDLASQQYWNVDTTDPNNYVWTSESQPAMPRPNDASGFNIIGNHIVRWGENDVLPDPNNPQLPFEQYVHTADDSQNNALNIHGYFTQFDDSTYTGKTPRANEAQASNGDSGGSVFSLVNGQWELSGIMIAVALYDHQPNATADFGDETFIADLSVYRTELLQVTSTVIGRDLFYANSPRYDTTGNPQTPLPFSDDNAIATDKSAYLPGAGPAVFANVSSYSKGVNGIMVDITGSHPGITASDFTFKIGNNNSPDAWSTAPSPTTVMVRSGVGASGSDRVELIWADGAIQQEWLEVTVLADANTDLTANDVFFYGNEIGDTGASNTATIFKVGAGDTTSTQTHLATLGTNQPITNIYDFNRDGSAGTGDITLDQIHGTTNSTGLVVISIGAGGPFAPLPHSGNSGSTDSGSGSSGVASALASTSTSTSMTPANGAWIVNRLEQLGLNPGPTDQYFARLAHENSAKSRAVLVKADRLADAQTENDALLDSLLIKLRLL